MRSILHVDMDAFFASVEQRDNPAYQGNPVVVGADPRGGKGRGVVSAASYEARQFGIHSAMPIRHAYQQCPQAVYLPVRMERYQEVSASLFEIFHRYTDLVESLSLDEAFLDVSGSHSLFGSAETIGRRIQEKVWQKERLRASVGIATNKFVAKVASDLEKPEGFVVVPPQKEREFLSGLPVERLWGAGLKTTRKLYREGFRTIGDIARQHQDTLRSLLGRAGVHLWHLANGLDDRLVISHAPVKTIGAETTFAKDTESLVVIGKTLLALSERVAQRLRTEGLGAQGLTLKYRDETFQTQTRSMVLSEGTNQPADIYRGAMKLLERIPPSDRKVRLVGLATSKLKPFVFEQQLSLFDQQETRKRSLMRAVDSIRDRFGDEKIQPGSLIDRENR